MLMNWNINILPIFKLLKEIFMNEQKACIVQNWMQMEVELER
jgi:hypothetical protein